MTKISNIQSIIGSELAQSWIESGVKSAYGSWQRDEACAGLRGAVQLAVGSDKSVSIARQRRFLDSKIVIDVHSISVNFARHQAA